MRKKYLSALLFGALLFASAGTFTSCKDYDDDINNLQEQINTNADAIKALQSKVDAGKWVTEVSAITNGFKVTFSDGQSFEVVNGADGAAGAAGADGTQITIGEDGYWYFDGEKSEYKAVSDEETGKTKAPYVNEEDGYWYFYNEDGTAQKSAYKALGAAYAVEYNGGYNIMIPDADGTMQTIFVPGAAASITSMTAKATELTINQYNFAPSDKNVKAWEEMTGSKVTTNKYILASSDKIGLRINPVNVDASGIDFTLVNSKNETLNGVVFTPEEYKDYVTPGDYVTRAAYGNGLYTLSMKSMELKDEDALNAFKKQQETGERSIAYAVSASTAIRAEYNITVATLETKADFGKIYINQKDIATNETVVDSKATNKVSVETPADLYGMWLTVSDEDKNLFNIQFNQEKHTFTVNADPDILTKATFELTIHTLNNNGIYATTKEEIKVSDKIAASPNYEKRTLNIVEDNTDALKNKNAFTADMATMLTALGDQVDVWKKKVDNYSYEFYTDKDCKTKVTNAKGINLIFVNAKGDAKAAIKDAANMKFVVSNDEASQAFEVDKEYYAKVTFNDNSSELNSIVVPFQFAIPNFADSFVQESAVFVDGIANAYMNVTDYAASGNKAAYKLSNAFAKYMKNAKLALDNKTKVVGNYTSDGLATISTTFDEKAMIILKDVENDKTTGLQKGYKQGLIVNASAEDYLGWAYPEGKGTYTFTIKVMSPLYEGSVSAIGDVVNIPATSVNGWHMTNEHIQGKTYNNISYKVLSDIVTGNQPDWSRPEVAKVEADPTNERVVKIGGVKGAQKDSKGVITEGYIQVLPQNIAATTETEINVSVTDIWGYTKVNPVKVKVTVGE